MSEKELGNEKEDESREQENKQEDKSREQEEPRDTMAEMFSELSKEDEQVQDDTNKDFRIIEGFTRNLGGDEQEAEGVKREVASITEEQRKIISGAREKIVQLEAGSEVAESSAELSPRAKEVLRIVLEEGEGVDEYMKKIGIGNLGSIEELSQAVEEDMASMGHDYEMINTAKVEHGKLGLSLDQLTRVKAALEQVRDKLKEEVFLQHYRTAKELVEQRYKSEEKVGSEFLKGDTEPSELFNQLREEVREDGEDGQVDQLVFESMLWSGPQYREALFRDEKARKFYSDHASKVVDFYKTIFAKQEIDIDAAQAGVEVIARIINNEEYGDIPQEDLRTQLEKAYTAICKRYGEAGLLKGVHDFAKSAEMIQVLVEQDILDKEKTVNMLKAALKEAAQNMDATDVYGRNTEPLLLIQEVCHDLKRRGILEEQDMQEITQDVIGISGENSVVEDKDAQELEDLKRKYENNLSTYLTAKEEIFKRVQDRKGLDLRMRSLEDKYELGSDMTAEEINEKTKMMKKELAAHIIKLRQAKGEMRHEITKEEFNTIVERLTALSVFKLGVEIFRLLEDNADQE